MNLNQLELVKDLMHAGGINFHVFEPPYADIARFDNRLRGNLFSDFQYDSIVNNLLDHCVRNTLYLVTDSFETHHFIGRLSSGSEDGSGDAFLFIGPYLIRDYRDILQPVMIANNLLVFQSEELKNYYGGIPRILEPAVLESEVVVLARLVFGTIDFHVDRTGLNLSADTEGLSLRDEPEKKLTMSVLEERYLLEDQVLEAVERGDLQNAILNMSAFRKFRYDSRNTDSVRDYKNYLFVLNTLLRKAVQRADVHPAYIDNTSSYFAIKVEAARVQSDLANLSQEMMRKYCLLVQNHSLRGHSQMVQKVMNYVSFHLDEPLTLSILADLIKINPSYLSTQFKKENQITLTDFINQKRIQHSLTLLNTTDLPIHRIAERVGILDENYFSRLFKQQTGKSPREYRKTVKMG